MSYISAYASGFDVSDVKKWNYYNLMFHGDPPIWTLGNKGEGKYLLWTLPWKGTRYAYQFIPDQDCVPFFEIFGKQYPGVKLEMYNGDDFDVYVYQTNELLKNFDIRNEMWDVYENDDLGGELCFIDILKNKFL